MMLFLSYCTGAKQNKEQGLEEIPKNTGTIPFPLLVFQKSRKLDYNFSTNTWKRLRKNNKK